MKRTLYIHVGPSKTGTSALQHVLSQHDNSVVLYPKVGLWKDGSHHNLVLNFFRNYNLSETVREDAGVLFARIRAQACLSDKPIVISSEMLADDFCAPDEFIRALLASLGGEFDVEILFTVRQHYDRAKSYYSQAVGDFFTCERSGPDEFLTQRLPELCYAPMLRRLLKAGFPIHLLKYEPAREIVSSLLKRIGFSEDRIPSPAARHQSISTMVLIAILAANRFATSQGLHEKITDRIWRMRDVHTPSRPIFGPDAIFAAEPAFRADRDFLRDDFGFHLAAPALTAGESGFWLNKDEYSKITAAIADLDDDVRGYREMLHGFVPHPG